MNAFKLKNGELNSFVIDLDRPGGKTLVSRRHAHGVRFTEDATGRLKTSSGQCIVTGSGTQTSHAENSRMTITVRGHP